MVETNDGIYAGLDVSLQATNVCVVDGDGNVVQEATLKTDPDAIELFLVECGIHGLEAFSYRAWLFTALSEKGLAVICIESRHAKAALNAMLNKTRRNAKGIAQMMRTGWFRTVNVKSESAQPQRALLVGRKARRGETLGMENMIHGLLRPIGLKVGEISVGRFDARVREIMAGKRELEAMVAPLFDARNAMRLQLAKLHRLALAAAPSDSAVRRMMTAPGVGALVAPTFRATVDDPARFKKSSNVAAHFGLTPRRYRSGQTDRIGSIFTCGDELTRAIP
ncbi:IS110 family transposase [Bradyrhizobium sp. 153]|uniref:IS110 family transposase n=1 Tax=Bradyrhizobium sp. 153 TaxID=2782627 RepID=UPI001FF8374F|nr:IS110 family transposase [Bradyrhizobium sp. 153]MCK1668950.1 IS110 family transposase [Bradyrhizobium sp. 153]